MRTNWAGNHSFMAPELLSPRSVAEVQSIVAAAAKVRTLGSGHSFNDIADSEGVQLSLRGIERLFRLEPDQRQVTVDGGMRYGDLAPLLHAQGWALANLASLPHISVAGAVMTATHGSGSHIGNLATQVTAMDFVSATGEIVTVSRAADAEVFAGSVVSLGALGPVVSLTLAVEPAYDVRQEVFTDLRHDVLAAEFDSIFAAATSVSVFTDWRGDRATAVWVKDRVAVGQAAGSRRQEFFGAAPARAKMHPLPQGKAADCTDQMGLPGPWYERLPHFRMDFAPSHGAEIQAEFFVPRENAAKVVAAMRRHGERLAPLLMISEVRTVAADDLWLSPGLRGPYVGVHFTFARDTAAVRSVLPAIEADLGELGAIPHWGKVTTMGPSTLRQRLPQLAAFRDLVLPLDPTGKFQNAYLQRVLFDNR